MSVPPVAAMVTGVVREMVGVFQVRVFAACVQVAVVLQVEVFVPAVLYELVGVHVAVRILVTVPEVLASPSVVPRLVAVRTPVLAFTAVNPF